MKFFACGKFKLELLAFGKRRICGVTSLTTREFKSILNLGRTAPVCAEFKCFLNASSQFACCYSTEYQPQWGRIGTITMVRAAIRVMKLAAMPDL